MVVQAFPDAFNRVVAVRNVAGLVGKIVAGMKPVGFLPFEPVAILAPDVEFGLWI